MVEQGIKNFNLSFERIMKTKNFENFITNINILFQTIKKSQIDNEIHRIEEIKIILNACSVLLGASLGDSMGSYCEFRGPSKENSSLIWTEKNKVFGTARGQVTDDTEMAINLSLGIIETFQKHDEKSSINGEERLNLNPTGFFYVKWLHSNPFDIGNTTMNALNIKNFKEFFEKKFLKNCEISNELVKNSKILNAKSLSNGFLMRHTPMTIYLYYLFETKKDDPEFNFDFKSLVESKKYQKIFMKISDIIRKEIYLTHFDDECVIAATIYDFLILCILILRYQDSSEIKEDFGNIKLDKYVTILKDFFSDILYSPSENPNLDFLKQKILKIFNEFNIIKNSEENGLKLIQLAGEMNIGYYLHSLNMIFYIINYVNNFKDVENKGIYRSLINFICEIGGDTDTNCCIVGGVIGAILTVSHLKKDYIEPHLLFFSQDEQNFQKRPFIYSPALLPFYATKLYSYFVDNIDQDQEGKSLEMLNKLLELNLTESESNMTLRDIGKLI